MLDVKYFQKIIKIFMLSPSLFLRRALCIDDVGNNVTSVFCWEDHCEHNNEAGMEKLIDTKTIWGLELSLPLSLCASTNPLCSQLSLLRKYEEIKYFVQYF